MTNENTPGGDPNFSAPKETIPTLEEVQMIQAEFEKAGDLDPQGIIDLILNGDPDQFDTVVRWTGGIRNPKKKPPIERFVEVVESDEFDELPEDLMPEFLSKASRLVLLDFDQKYQQKRAGRPGVATLMRNDLNHKLHTDNMRALFGKALKYTNDDVDKARQILSRNLSKDKKNEKSATKLALLSIINPISGRKDEEVRDPRVTELAFWISVDIGDFRVNGGNFVHLTEEIYKNAAVGLKVQILRYVNRELGREASSIKANREMRMFYRGLSIDPNSDGESVAAEIEIMSKYLNS